MSNEAQNQKDFFAKREELMKTPQGRTLVMDSLILGADVDSIEDTEEGIQKKIAILEEKIRVSRFIQSGAWREFLPKPKIDRIYFILDVDRKCIKIGYSANVDIRFENLQHGNPGLLKLLATIEGGRSKEHKLHKRFAHLKVRGEWFKDCKELRSAIKELVAAESVS